jgi:dTDP-4-amino-4,6-dideoxygalactose transaminase
MVFRVPFSGVGAKYSELEKQAVLCAMDADDTLTQGVYQERFQEKFSNFVGVKHSYATSSAAAALELAAILLNFEKGDQVICPAHTYNASAYPFAKHGASLVWADINKDTWVVDVESINAVVTDRTKAIVVVHLYGAPANMPAIMDYAKQKNIYVIEDCAQAIGGSINGKSVGSYGDMSVFSFHGHKNISTLGEGGMICTNDDQWAKLIPGLRHNGHAPYANRDPRYYWLPAMSNVDVDIDGVWPNNFCIGEVQCALGEVMLPRVAEINNLRRKRFHEFSKLLACCSQFKLQKFYNSAISTHHLLPIMCSDESFNRDLIIERLAYQYGVQAIVQYYPLNRYPLFQKNGFGVASIPNTDALFDNMISLPFHHWLSDDDFVYMTNALLDCVTKP